MSTLSLHCVPAFAYLRKCMAHLTHLFIPTRYPSFFNMACVMP